MTEPIGTLLEDLGSILGMFQTHGQVDSRERIALSTRLRAAATRLWNEREDARAMQARGKPEEIRVRGIHIEAAITRINGGPLERTGGGR